MYKVTCIIKGGGVKTRKSQIFKGGNLEFLYNFPTFLIKIEKYLYKLVLTIFMIDLPSKRSRKGYNVISLDFSLSDLRLLKLYISHHNLCDHRGILVSPRMFLHGLVRSWIDDELYSFKCGLGLGALDLEDLENGK